MFIAHVTSSDHDAGDDTQMVGALIATHPEIATREFVCPSCGGRLSPASEAVLQCDAEGASYRNIDGIWELIAPSRRAHFENFVREYDRVRTGEGRGSDDPRYFRDLPYRDHSGRFSGDWRIRAASFDCFVRGVLAPLESRRLKILDLGAGNGWLSYRMALRGHEAVAVDLRTDARDGLGAHVQYDRSFVPVCAEFDRLPFEEARFDVVVFNASFHYAERFETTLREALRVAKPVGRIVVMDSPIYSEASSGIRMVRARTAAFQAKYGCTSDSVPSEHFLTDKRLVELAVRAGVTWERHHPPYGIRWEVRRAVSRVRNGREPARFVVLSARRKLEVSAEIERITPARMLRRIGRAALTIGHLPARRRIGRGSGERVGDIRLEVPPGVFNPVVFRSGRFMGEVIAAGVLPARSRVIDVGTGSGVCAIAAARQGHSVVAVDINPKAVEATRRNAAINDVRITAVHGDLFADLGRYDVVLFNPPYFRGTPTTPFEQAWKSNDVVERFSERLHDHLEPDGFALVVLSSDGCSADFLRRFEGDGYRIARVAERRFLNETLVVYRLG